MVSKKLDESFIERARALMKRRRAFRASLPLNPHVLYSAILGAEREAAMNLLLASPSLMFHMGHQLRVEVGQYRCTITLTTAMPRLCAVIGEEHPVFSDLMTWAARWKEADIQANTAVKTLEVVAKKCRTQGDLLRVWPAIAKLFYPENKKPSPMRERMRNLTAKVSGHEELQHTMQLVEAWLAEALMVPDGCKEVAYLE